MKKDRGVGFDMRNENYSRRELLSGMGVVAAGGLLAAGMGVAAELPARGESAMREGQSLDVRDFGAAGDGIKDDTESFNRALKAAADKGNFAVFVPRGKFLIKGELIVPANVALEGVYIAPAGRTKDAGSVLLAVAGAGNADGNPFITLHTSSTLRGITIFYPEQVMKNPPAPYPWTIRGVGDNISLIDVLLVNPYQAVDFGTQAAGRHFINGLYGQPLYRGIFVDNCFDVGRIANVHFWSFWGGWEGPLYEFMREKAVAFLLAKSDWEFMTNCFCIGYRIGYHFVQNARGPGNYLLTQCGSDIGPNAVRVDASQAHAGNSFVNCQFMSGIEVGPGNNGPLKFTACGFWGIATTDYHALLEGAGHTFFNGCHFIGWGQKDTKRPAIHAMRGGVTVTACDFIDLGKAQVTIEKDVDAAIIYGNRLRGREMIVNRAAPGRAQIGMNAVTPK